MLLHLKSIVEMVLPNATLQFKWGLPFYYISNKPFCYLNATKGYVDIAFMNGSELRKYPGLLNGKNRKMVKSLRYKSLEEIDDVVLMDVLKESYSLKSLK